MAFRYIEIKSLIFDQIVHMNPNDKIPSRTVLCNQYMVTRTTVDRAISELIGEGHLYSVDGSGTYVSDFTGSKTTMKKNVINIGVLLPNIMHDTYPGILRGVEDVAESQEINVVICNTDNDSEKQLSDEKRLLNSKVSGMIIIPAANENQNFDLYQILLQADIPFVFCNRAVAGIDKPLISSNDFYGGFVATKHLLECGYKKIAYLSTMRYSASIDRYHGYLAAHWETGVLVDEELVSLSNQKVSSADSGYAQMNKLLNTRDDIDGVFCFNDQIACGAINAMAECGLHVSDDIGVIGYDNTSICETMSIKLTSISYRNYEIGSNAAQILCKMIQDTNTPVERLTIFQPEIVVRSSCLGKCL
ncbi:MAG: substrate-binding domain-containing protein [Ruminiclostridium sp.]